MDVDAYVARHRAEWQRLAQLVRKRRLRGSEVDELVDLYQRTATHLSVVRSASPDPALVAHLSQLVANARSAVAGSYEPAWREVGRFFRVSFPVAVYRAWPWWCGVAASFVALGTLVGWWVAGSPEVQRSIATPEEVRRLVERDFANYYRENPAASFAAQVWTNNAWIAALCVAAGVLLLPVVWVVLQNAVNVGVVGGLMVANGKGGLFFGLVAPHGLLELTAVFVAAGVGLRLGWAWVDPGPRSRAQALAEEGRSTVTVALGLVAVLALSGVVEAFVTPSPLPTAARIAIGAAALGGFLTYVVVLGRRAAAAGDTGDVVGGGATDVLPVSG